MAIGPYRTALVTGASRGIGAAICRRLAARGMAVIGLARDAAALEALAVEIGITPLVADVTDTAAVTAGLGAAEIDVLISNAGYVAAVRPLHEQTSEEIDRTIDVNLRAPLHLARALLPGMIARRRGHVIHVTTTAAHAVFGGTAPYGAAKAGLSHAGAVMRYDLVGTGVRLTEIVPGRVETDVYLTAFGGDRERLRGTMYADVRALQPDDVAAAVVAALDMPEHVDIARLDVVPTDQAPGGHRYADRPE
ncbi:SDR family oxidoreductase [Methylobrevis pamukkalensis]|uniref:NADP-dependent 3-hydroxy acid dehydrogenase YdfG n=1 Tax=Methylobrevis pamukkalensis TaxID=1439726 RepID=A0A1E3H4J7_9HYPH|nr:SDR family NAD(P)-dependent oxidoreductase [Methylobrevis pamukkalensis]ODN71234.1 NADP-dependent 3-hydroxy acid dehydrogenase YdfG [Methylobrevis pamukkalensis]